MQKTGNFRPQLTPSGMQAPTFDAKQCQILVQVVRPPAVQDLVSGKHSEECLEDVPESAALCYEPGMSFVYSLIYLAHNRKAEQPNLMSESLIPLLILQT
eukprot:1150113-Pelagomonas_calceolata.AAC.1